MKALTILFIVFCANSAFSQLSASSPKNAQITKTDSIHPYINNNLITNKNMEDIEDHSPVYMKYVVPDEITDSVTLMVDSTLVNQNYLTYLDPNEINSINILKDPKYPSGIIFIKLKNHALLSKILNSKLLSFNDITNTYLTPNSNHKPIIYLLNKELVTDTAKRRIPEICLAHVIVAQASDMPYFKTAMTDVLVVMITTKPVSTKPYRPDIMIRGSISN